MDQIVETERHLLFLARGLLELTDTLDTLNCIGKCTSRMFHPGATVLLTRSDGVLSGIEFDGAGARRQLGFNADLLANALRILDEVEHPLLQQKQKIEEAFVWAKFGYPAGAGIMLVAWPAGTEPSDLSNSEQLVQAVSELAGAALRKLHAREFLELRLSEQTRELESVSEAHAREIARRDAIENAVRRLSLTDELTGLRNRRGFFLDAEHCFKVARRQRVRCAVVFIDVDNLKVVNDKLGHGVGDQLLQESAGVLRASLRETDIVARLGGDEFAAFTIDAEEPGVLLDRLEENLEQINSKAGRKFAVSFSTGVVQIDPDEQSSLADYLLEADKRMYEAKQLRRQ